MTDRSTTTPNDDTPPDAEAANTELADAEWADARREDCLALQKRAHDAFSAGDKAEAWRLLQEAVHGRREILAWGKPGDLSFELASACVQAIFAAPDDKAANAMYTLAADTLNPLVASGVEHPRLTQLLDGLARIGGAGKQ